MGSSGTYYSFSHVRKCCWAALRLLIQKKKKHREPLSICEQCCNTSKIKCGKAIRTTSLGLFIFFFYSVWMIFGSSWTSSFHFFSVIFLAVESIAALFLVLTSPRTDFLRVGDEDVSCCQQMFHFLLWFHYFWLSIIGLTWGTESWLGSRNCLPEDPLNFLSWNFSPVSGGLCFENANRIRLACAEGQTVSSISNTWPTAWANGLLLSLK